MLRNMILFFLLLMSQQYKQSCSDSCLPSLLKSYHACFAFTLVPLKEIEQNRQSLSVFPAVIVPGIVEERCHRHESSFSARNLSTLIQNILLSFDFLKNSQLTQKVRKYFMPLHIYSLPTYLRED